MERRSFIKGAAAAVGGYTLLGTTGCAPPPIAGQGYELVWNDEFDTLRPIWQPEPWYASNFDWSRVSVADSILTLTAVPDASAPALGATTLASIGPASTTYPYRPLAATWQEGYFEIRARCSNDPWTKLALWFMSVEHPNTWPDRRDCTVLNAEWDMVENGVRANDGPAGYADVCHFTALHRNTSSFCEIPDTQRTMYVEGLSNLCDWHIWGGRWTSTDVSTYLDGQLLTTQPIYPDSTPQPMYMLLTAGTTNSQPPGNPPRPATLETQVDWVRVWKKAS